MLLRGHRSDFVQNRPYVPQHELSDRHDYCFKVSYSVFNDWHSLFFELCLGQLLVHFAAEGPPTAPSSYPIRIVTPATIFYHPLIDARPPPPPPPPPPEFLHLLPPRRRAGANWAVAWGPFSFFLFSERKSQMT